MEGEDERMEVVSGSDDSGDIIGPSDEEEDGETENLTPREVLDRIETGWMNEKIAPELLPPLDQERDAMTTQIKAMERNLVHLDKRDMRTDIHKLEVERVKFIVVSYMRTRLFKIQKLAFFYYESEQGRHRSQPSILMEEERVFLKKFVERTEEYLHATLLSKFPSPMAEVERSRYARRPQSDTHVFFRVLEGSTIEAEDVEGETHLVTLGVGDQIFMRYAPVAKLLFTKSIYLV